MVFFLSPGSWDGLWCDYGCLNNQFTFKLLLILLILKIIVFSLSLGSGGFGGTIIPSLFVGTMLGGAFGTVVDMLYPGMTAGPGLMPL